MKKLHDIMMRFFFLMTLPVILFLLWNIMETNGWVTRSTDSTIVFLRESLSFLFMVWFSIGVFFVLSLLWDQNRRERILKVIFGTKERDEREERNLANSAKYTLFSTIILSVVMFLYFSFPIVIKEIPSANRISNHSKELTIQPKFEWLVSIDEIKNSKDKILFSTGYRTPTPESVILIMIIWQVVSFIAIYRRYSRV